MKKIVYVLIACLLGGLCGGVFGIVSATGDDGNVDLKCTSGALWKCYDGAKPMDVLNDLVKNEKAIGTQLDKVDRGEGQYKFPKPFMKSAGTFESVRQNIDVYLQWIAFLGLSFAVILIIYNGILLMFTPLSPDQAGVVKKRIGYLALGVVVITGFYFILKIFLSIFIDIVAS